jgi:hypothetical protein
MGWRGPQPPVVDHSDGGLRVDPAASRKGLQNPLDSKRCSMKSAPQSSSLRIDEQWLKQWIAFGMLELTVYLTRQAAFADYLSQRDQPRKSRKN